MTRLEQAQQFDVRYGRVEREPLPHKYTPEHFTLAAAFIKGEISSTAFRTCAGLETSGNHEYLAYRMLREGIARGFVSILVCAPPNDKLPRVCDGGVEVA